MKTELRSNVLSASTIQKVMPACVLYALVQSMTFMVDTMVAGRLLGPDAVAAVALGIPIIGIIPTQAESVTFVSEKLQRFFLDHGTPPKVAFAAALCMEETPQITWTTGQQQAAAGNRRSWTSRPSGTPRPSS